MGTKFPILESSRLYLRQISAEDASFIHFMRSDPIVNQFVNRKATTSVQDALAFVVARREDNTQKKAVYWSICESNEGRMMGSICLWNLNMDTLKGEIGYDLHPDFQGKGHMLEAIQAVVEYGFGGLGLQQIIGITSPENIPSQKVMQRAGFTSSDEVLSEKDIKNKLIGFVLNPMDS